MEVVLARLKDSDWKVVQRRARVRTGPVQRHAHTSRMSVSGSKVPAHDRMGRKTKALRGYAGRAGAVDGNIGDAKGAAWKVAVAGGNEKRDHGVEPVAGATSAHG